VTPHSLRQLAINEDIIEIHVILCIIPGCQLLRKVINIEYNELLTRESQRVPHEQFFIAAYFVVTSQVLQYTNYLEENVRH